MSRVVESLQTALRQHQAGDIAAAERVYLSILEENPDHAGAWHLLGLVHFQKKQPHQAKTEIERALGLCDTKAVYWNNYGTVLRGLGLIEDAKGAFERALSILPRYADAISNLALCLRDLGAGDLAYRGFKSALEVEPDHRDALRHLAELCAELGRVDEAMACYRNLARQAPHDAESWEKLGKLYMRGKSYAEAVRAFRQAIALQPGNAGLRRALANTLVAQGDVAEATRTFKEAARLQPDRPSWRYRHLSAWPYVFADEESIDREFDRLGERLDEAVAASFEFDWRRCLQDGFCPPFGLTHQGRCCRSLKERFARLFALHFPQERPAPRNASRLRIGFLVTEGRERGFLRNMEHIVPGLDRERFEAVVLCPESGLELCRRKIGAEHVRWVPYPHEFERSVEVIAGARCDILYHRQIGTAVTNYFFPFARCAPIQCTGWGSHGTTGIGDVDFYLSSDLIEIEGGSSHYTERLFQFHDTFPTCQSRIGVPQPAKREDFGLPAHGGVYFCPQRIEKIHPKLDGLLRGVLETDGEGTIVMLRGSHPVAFDALIARFARTLGQSLLDRILFVPPLGVGDYYRLFSTVDVVLDAPNYSTSLTGFDAFSLGVPVVTLPGVRNVERYGAGLCRKMGIEELIVGDEQEYIARATRIGSDADYGAALRERIRRCSHVLFEDREAIREHERFFEYAWQQREGLSRPGLAVHDG